MTSSRQGFLRHLRMSPRMIRLGMNLWPPVRGAGIRSTRVSADYREVDVALRLRVLNRNCFGTQFGGSLCAMADPFCALMMVHALGGGYVVWDMGGAIRSLKPGRGPVHARLRLESAAVEAARAATAGGGKHEPTFSVDIVDADGDVVAVVDNALHIRRHEPPDGPGGRSA